MTKDTPLKNNTPPQAEYISEIEVEQAKQRMTQFKLRLRPTNLQEITSILDTTIKHDNTNKQILFLTMLLNYTYEDQQNINFNAPSSTGKSYLALQVAEYFPQEDVDIHSYTSPTAFFHELGKLKTKDGEPLEDKRPWVKAKLEEWRTENPCPEKIEKNGKQPQENISAIASWKKLQATAKGDYQDEWDKIEKIYEVDLEKRIIIFVDMPHDRLLQVLRALLSHDKKMLPVKITDKTKEGGHRTKNIVVKGFPTVVFASANYSMDAQEQTRFWLLSPEMNEQKIEDSLILQSFSIGNRVAYQNQLEADMQREFLKQRVRAIKNQNIQQIIIPELEQGELLRWFMENRSLSPRHQRDFPRVLALVKAHALLNLFQRERTDDQKSIYANQEDVEAAKTLMNGIIDANELGLPPYVFKFYFEGLESYLTEEGISRKELSSLYRAFYRERLGENARKNMIELLEEAGLVFEDIDPDDKRRMRIYPLQGGVENFEGGNQP